MIDIFQQLQHAIAGVILSSSYLDGIGVFIARPTKQPDGTVVDAPGIQTAIETALLGITSRNSKAGVAVSVLMPRLGNWNHLVKNPQEKIHVTVRVQENVLINYATGGTFLSAEDVANNIALQLHHFQAGSHWKLLPEEENTILPVDPGVGNEVAYEVNFFTFNGRTALARVAYPTLVANGGFATLATATAGADIYYTTDGTFPYSGNANATLYSTPFAVTTGDHVKLCAFHSGLAPSGVQEGIIT